MKECKMMIADDESNAILVCRNAHSWKCIILEEFWIEKGFVNYGIERVREKICHVNINCEQNFEPYVVKIEIGNY